ncbi:hypothetical protein [Candidatus Arsenophonus triatominarum]|uniref:hypothetical protein n=1 Tax=Candidatus Arsenophonus triatominarum TaxID=57911 RepID=UPI0007C52681|nr:hypothetical protein [Candidatus Arsenophonus triatominarum]
MTALSVSYPLSLSTYSVHAKENNKIEYAYNFPSLEALKSAARNNDDFSIDCLFTLACENSPAGLEAESFLFDLYTGKEEGHPYIKEQLGKDSLKLWEIVQGKNKNTIPEEAWSIPDKILIMAGFETQERSQQREEILEEINKNVNFCVCVDDGEPVSSSFFHTNRLITSAELDSISKSLNSKEGGFKFHDAVEIAATAIDNEHIPQKLLSTLLNIDNKGKQIPSLGDFIPLLFRGHWVLFGLSTTESGDKSAILFDSTNYLNNKEMNFIKTLAGSLGTNEISVVKESLQENAPNACGLFVSNAMKSIANNLNKTPYGSLTKFVKSFLELNNTEQMLFNQRGRAELYGYLLDNVSSLI